MSSLDRNGFADSPILFLLFVRSGSMEQARRGMVIQLTSLAGDAASLGAMMELRVSESSLWDEEISTMNG